MKKTITNIVIVLILVALVLVALTFDWGRGVDTTTNTATTTEDVLIIPFSPTENQEVYSPIRVTGKAKGFWFFEAVFPIDLVNLNGDIISQGYATADGEWMTTEFVNFYAYIEYPATSTGRALLVLKKDNPSGLSEYDDSIFIPVILK